MALALSSYLSKGDYDLYYNNISEQAINFRKTYGTVPDEHTIDIIENLSLLYPNDADTYHRIYQGLRTFKSKNYSKAWVLDQAATFCRRQKTLQSTKQAFELAVEGSGESLDKAEELLRNLFKGSKIGFNPGILLNDPAQSLGFLDKSTEEKFPTGIPELDAVSACPKRGCMLVIMALLNKGKSWFAIDLGKKAWVQGSKVLHITCEMSAKKVAKRYFQNMFSISDKEGNFEYERFLTDNYGNFNGSMKVQYPLKRVFSDKEYVDTGLKNDAESLTKLPNLYIKEFPTGQLTFSGLLAYLDGLESIKFLPDLIILDSPGNMCLDRKNYRLEIGRLAAELRGIAMQRNIAMVCPYQGNRGGFRQYDLDETNIGEDISILQTADDAIFYNQSKSEYKRGLARLDHARARDSEKGTKVIISQNYATGQFCLSSAKMSSTYKAAVEVETTENNDE